MDRILTWYIDEPSDGYAKYFINRDCSPIALRINANTAPDKGDLVVDILDDDVSIMASNVATDTSRSLSYAEIEYHTLATSSFSEGESVSGTGGAAGIVVSDNGIGSMVINIESDTTAFVVGETITGATSLAMAVLNAYVVQARPTVVTVTTEGSKAILIKGETSSEDAEDFAQNDISIEEGSWVSLTLTPSGAKQITIQLELDEGLVGV